MKASRKLGIWMDHSMAYLMEFTTNPFEIITVESDAEEKINSATTFEAMMATKKKLLFTYYNQIANEIRSYNNIILFGPTNAKVELFDVLSEDEHFLKVKVEIKNTDKMTPTEQHKFIKAYFSKS